MYGGAEGRVNTEEEDIVRRYREEFFIGISEIRSLFRSSVVIE